MKKLFLFLLLPFLGFSQETAPLFIDPSQRSFDVVKHISFLEDQSSQLTIRQILVAYKAKQFKSARGNLGFGISTSAYWLYFKTQNGAKADNLILRFQDPGIDNILVYRSNSLIADMGDLYPFYARPIIDKDFVVRLPQAKYQSSEYFVRLEKKGESLSLPIQLLREHFYHQYHKNEYLFWGFFIGMALAMVLLNLLTFINFRENVFLYSSAYIFFFSAICTTGLGYEFLWYNFPMMGFFDTSIVSTLTVVFHLLFIQAFMSQTIKKNRWLFMANRATIVFLLCGTVIGVWGALKNEKPSIGFVYFVSKFLMVILPIYFILVFVNIHDGFMRKQQGIYYILSSVSAVIGAMFLTLLVKNGWLYLPFTATYLLPLGILIDSLIITFAQTKRFNDLAKERQLFLSELMDSKNQIIQTQESERQRIAADLHDDLGGTLATIRRLIADIRQNLKDPRVAKDFELLEPLIQKSGDDLRRISHNLMPPEFAHLGLANALQQFVQAIPQKPTHFEFLISGEERKLPIDIEVNLYRIVSELVQNILKHAQATRAAVQLIYFDDLLTITVEDNGIGNHLINKSSEIPEVSSGIGLKNSKLRAEYIGATLRMEASAGGTLVILEIPYPPTENDASPPKNSTD